MSARERATRIGAALVLGALLLVVVGVAAAWLLPAHPPVGPTIVTPSPHPYPSGWTYAP